MNANPVIVLVIESHPMMREALCVAITETIDLQATMQAGSVTDALTMVKGITPNIILLALGHTGGSDLDDLTMLHKSLPAIPILALTSNEVFGQEQAALEHGAQVVLTKAVPYAELIYTLRKLRAQTMLDD